MSKSHDDPRSRIHINDDPEVIRDKVRLALTDSIVGLSFDRTARPGVSNLLSIWSFFDDENRTAEGIAQAYSGMAMPELKAKLTSVISEGLANVRENYNRLINDHHAHYLDDIAMEGSAKARRQARTTMDAVRHAVGL